jgi:hypothetical protein
VPSLRPFQQVLIIIDGIPFKSYNNLLVYTVPSPLFHCIGSTASVPFSFSLDLTLEEAKAQQANLTAFFTTTMKKVFNDTSLTVTVTITAGRRSLLARVVISVNVQNISKLDSFSDKVSSIGETLKDPSKLAADMASVFPGKTFTLKVIDEPKANIVSPFTISAGSSVLLFVHCVIIVTHQTFFKKVTTKKPAGDTAFNSPAVNATPAGLILNALFAACFYISLS